MNEGLTIRQQRKAIDYTLLFLKNETERIKQSIEECTHKIEKELLLKRYKELERDLIEFEQIGDEW